MQNLNILNAQKVERISVFCRSHSRALRFRRTMTVMLLLLATLGAKAADYVIRSGNYYIGMNAAGDALEAKSVIDESCVWTTASALSTTSQSVQNKKNAGKYLVASCTRSGTGMSRTYTWALSVGNSSAVWRGDNGNFYAYYATTGMSSWNRSASLNVTSAGITLADNITTNSRYCSVTQGTDDGATYYEEATGQYVITSANAHFLGGTSTADITAFSPSTCLWTGTSGDTWENSAGYYLRYSSGLSLSAYNSTDWTISNTCRLYYDGYTDRYLCYDSGWTTNTSSSNNDQYNLVYPVAKRTYLEQSANPTISGDATFTAKGSKTYSSAGESYIPKYINYIFYNNSDHYFKTDNSTALSAKPTTSESFAYAWALSANASGHVTVDDDGLVSYNTYYEADTEVTLTLTATSESGKVLTATKAIMFESPKADPTGITATIDKSTIYVGETGNVSYTLQGTPCYDDVTFSSSNTSVATVDEHTGVVTAVGVGSATITATAHPYTAGGTNKTATVTVTVKNKVATPVITFTPTSADGGNTAKATIDCSTEGATVSYSINDGTWTTYPAGGFTVNNLDVVKAKAVMANNPSWDDSEIATVTYSKQKVPTPTINVSGGSVTFSCEEPDVTFYYTIGASPADPAAATGTEWKEGDAAITGITNEHYIKVIATKSGFSPSGVASRQYIASSGTSDDVVILNDYEDHNWTYYQSNDKLPTGYPTGYLNSPDPRNVKITYRGGGVEDASSVAISGLSGEGQNTMVYYKTLEKHDLSVKDDGNYAYTVISNPFSKRPKKGSTYYGFAGWKVISGAEYIQRATGKTTPVNNTTVLDLDETIHFVNLDNGYTPNCTSAEVVFEATWTAATVKNLTSTSVPTFTGGTYETNFLLLGANVTNAITISSPCTLMARNPDGTIGNYNNYSICGVAAGTNNVKLEYIQMYLGMYTNAYVKAEGYNFTIGRGVNNTFKDSPSSLGGFVYGLSSNKSSDNTIKIESGQYYLMMNFGTVNEYVNDDITVSGTRTIRQLMVLGCDYDRATGNNNNLSFKSNMWVANGSTLNRGQNELYVRNILKSGNFVSSVTVSGNASYSGSGSSQSFYNGVWSTSIAGHRYLEMQGGRIPTIAGGTDTANSADSRGFTLRVKGSAQIDGVVFGGGEYAGAKGVRSMVFTGGTVNGWIAGGANGTKYTGGDLPSPVYMYVGGNTKVKSNGSTQVLNSAVGGNVFGAGCGFSSGSQSGQVNSSYVVAADNAEIERGVYGGGAFGYSNGASSIYITGNCSIGGNNGGVTVGSVSGTSDDATRSNVAYSSVMIGGVFGGANQNKGASTFILMDGGKVSKGGVFGGSNAVGTLSGDVTMQINGGQVGTSSASANVHGGGYGSSTRVLGSVNLTVGANGATTGAAIYGDVYGGSAEGKTNGNTSLTSGKVTNVTLNAGTINGSLYGGGLGTSGTGGNAADVYGPVAVKVYGGSVMTTDENGANGSGAVYGCNNINGAPQRTVTVDVYGTDPHDVGSKTNDPSDDKYALFAVYGGGNQAAYTYTDTETGKIYPQVTIHNCDNSIEYVYGGGSQATVPGTQVKVYGGNVIGNVFGGGNNANVTSKGTDVDIYGGTILNVFGGNNNGGAVTGNISVTIDAQAETTGDDPCDMSLGNVYGGGNIASYTGNPVVNFLNGTSTGSVFGGGKGKDAIVVGNPVVNIGDWNNAHEVAIGGSVFGGGDLAAVEGNPIVTIRNCGTTIGGDLYGGGNAAPVYSTNTTMWGGTVKGNVFGGGNGSDPTKNTNGAQVGYMHDDTTEGTGDGNAVTNIYGGTIGTWTTVGGVQTCTAGGGIFGGSNTNGNIRGAVTLTIDEQACTETDAEQCDLKMKEAYGAGNEAPFTGSGVTLNLGCITSMDEIYGGAKKADMKGDVNLRITNGHFGKVFGGNNISGKLDGKIVVTVDEMGCKPVTIGALYGGGNKAAYSVYGYDTDGNVKTDGESPYADPMVNIVSFTSIDTIFGGGLGSTAVMVGNPRITVQQVAGKYDPDDDNASDGYAENTTGKLGVIGTIFGGGNEAQVEGTPEIRIATEDAILRADGTTSLSRKSANISGNVYGGGNKAQVNGNTKVVIGPKKN